MHPPVPTLAFSRRAILGVLALWWCVVAATVCAPLARAHWVAQHVERVCSGEAAMQWVPSPMAHGGHGVSGEGAALHHWIDCPLCLPVLAPPPAVQQPAVQALPVVVPLAVATGLLGAPWRQWPPARGPPLSR